MKKAISTLMNKQLHCRVPVIPLFVFLSLHSSICIAATSDSARTEVPLDGLASVISFSATDESSAVLILNSDVELLARMLLVTHHGEKWQDFPVDSVVKFKARRLGVIVRLLAHVATQVGEKVDNAKRDKWIARFSEMAGGDKAIDKMLDQTGTSRRDLEYWFSNLQLCRIQLQYMSDKIQMPDQTEMQKLFRQGDHPLAGASWKDAEKAFEKIVRNKKLQRILTEWISRFEEQGSIRFP